jgi:hypothetical protein
VTETVGGGMAAPYHRRAPRPGTVSARAAIVLWTAARTTQAPYRRRASAYAAAPVAPRSCPGTQPGAELADHPTGELATDGSATPPDRTP